MNTIKNEFVIRLLERSDFGCRIVYTAQAYFNDEPFTFQWIGSKLQLRNKCKKYAKLNKINNYTITIEE